MLLYLHHRNSRPFFILQSVITSKMRKYETIKLFELHKAKQKLAGLKNVRPNQFGTFQGRFSMFFGIFFLNIVASELKSCIFLNIIMNLSSPSEPLFTLLNYLYSGWNHWILEESNPLFRIHLFLKKKKYICICYFL